jgi:hypothetical protein
MGCNCKSREQVKKIEDFYKKRGGEFLPKKREKVGSKQALNELLTWKGFVDGLYRLLLVIIGIIVMIPVGVYMVFFGWFSKSKIFDYQKFLGLKKKKRVNGK